MLSHCRHFILVVQMCYMHNILQCTLDKGMKPTKIQYC